MHRKVFTDLSHLQEDTIYKKAGCASITGKEAAEQAGCEGCCL